MLKSFFYHCRTIKANGWIVAIIPLALLAIGLFIGSNDQLGATLGILVFTLFMPFLILALASSSDSKSKHILVKSLPMTRKELVKGSYLFLYSTISAVALFVLLFTKLALIYNKISFDENFSENLGYNFLIYWFGLLAIYSILLPLLKLYENIFSFVFFFGCQVILMIYIASDSVSSMHNPLYILILALIVLITMPLSYKLSLKNDLKKWEE